MTAPRARMSRRLAAPLLLATALAGCAVGPDYHRPALPAAAGYGVDVQPGPGGVGPSLALGQDVDAQWWRALGSADLDALVDEALKNNPNLDAAKSALRAAHEATLAQRGAYFPTVAVSIQPSRQQFAPTLSSPTASGAELYTLTTTQLSVGYTPDLFGANRRAVEQAAAQEEDQRFELEAARLTLVNSVVAAAVQDALLRDQIKATQEIIKGQGRTLASFQRQLQLGQASQADLAAQEALLAQAQANLPPLEKAFEINRDQLAALVGRTPAQPVDKVFDLSAFTLPASLPVSLPARLVEQRPDVRKAEAQLHAASAGIGMAVAARLPNLDISASAGGATLGLGATFNSMTTFWSVAGTLTQPIFEGGTLLHRQRGAEASYRQAAAQYKSTVVGAFQNVADSLQAVQTDTAAAQAADVAQAATGKSLQIARRQLELGDVSPLALISAEQSDDQARLTALQARANLYGDVAALFQALGGGWWNEDKTSGVPAS